MAGKYTPEEIAEIRYTNITSWRNDPEKVKAAQDKRRETVKRKTEMRKEIQYILNAELDCQEEIAQELEAIGYTDKSEIGAPTYQTAMLFGILKKAIYNQDVEAAKFIRDTSGQKPVDGMQIGTLDDKPLEINLSSMTNEQLLELINSAE